MENQDFTNNESACENEAWQNKAEQNEQISKMEALSTTEIDITTIGKSEKSNAKKISVSPLVFIVSLLLAVLVTFETTFLIMSSISNREKAELADEYNQMLEDEYGDLGVFKSVIEMYNSLPEDNRNPELYYKLAMIDYYYRSVYANKIDEDKLLYYVMNGYVVGAEDRYGEYYTADDFESRHIGNDSIERKH